MTGQTRGYRLVSIDMLRGLAIVIMALDHVRDFVMVGGEMDPMSNPRVGAALFFTRWITHFCAPVFVFLAGTSAGLMTARRTPAALATFLFTRGLWLLIVEVLVVATAWSFAPFGIAEMGGLVLVPLQVIWAIGVSLIVLAILQRLGPRACLVIGGVIIAGHNLLDPVWPVTGGLFETSGHVWTALHAQAGRIVGPFHLAFVYPVLPWIGVILAGFGSAPLFRDAADRRDARLFAWGLAVVAAFIALRAAGVYGDPNPWGAQDDAVATIIDFLNITKYPPSLLYLLMTLGPAAIFCSYADRLPEDIRRPLTVFGRAPFAFYVAHLYVIHVVAIVLGVAQGFAATQFFTFSFFFPKGYGLGLPGVYVVWLLVVAALYPLCAWVAAVKDRRRDWWLSYL